MKTGLRFAGRIGAYYILCLFLCLLFVANLDNDWLRIPINVALLAGLILMCYNEGGYRGERACTLAASLEKQLKEGRAIDPDVASQVWKPAVAVRMVAWFVIPLWLLSAANLIAAPFYPDVDEMLATELLEESATPDPETSPAGAEATPAPQAADAATAAPAGDTATTAPADDAATTAPADAGATIAPAADAAATAPDASLDPGATALPEEVQFDASQFNWFHVACRLVFMPFVFTYSLVSQKVLSLLYFLYALLFPLAALWGYMNGPKLRDKKLKAMYKGKRRKMRNLKVNKPPRKPKAEV